MIDYLSGLPDNSAAIASLYQRGCCQHHLPALQAPDDDWADAMADDLLMMVARVYRDRGLPQGHIDTGVTNAIGRKLLQGIQQGWASALGQAADSIDYDSPDIPMLQQLQRNTWHFSAAKNYQQLVALSRALVGEDGRLRTWPQFQEAAMAINDQHIRQWLRVEYDNAVAGAQMAADWQEIQRTSDTFPLLQFDVILDQGTSEICRPLAGVIVRANDPMLSTYYPPNHFGCRTRMRQLRSGTITPTSSYALPDIPAMFRTNVGVTGMAFPPGHPYFIGLPPEVAGYRPPQS